MSNKLIIDGNALLNGGYKFSPAGGVERLTGPNQWATVSGDELKSALQTLLRDAKIDPANLNHGAREWLKNNIHGHNFANQFDLTKPAEKLAREGMISLQQALEFAATQNSNFNVDALKDGILKHGELGEKLLSPATLEAAEKAGLKLADMASLRADCEKLKVLLKIEAGKPVDFAQVKSLLTKNHASADKLAAAIGTAADAHLGANHGTSLSGLAATVRGEVTSAESALRVGIEAIKSKAEYVKMLEANTSPADIIATAKKELTEASEAVSKMLGKQSHQEAFKVLSEDKTFAGVLEEARKVAPELDKHAKGIATAAKEASKGAKWFTGGKWHSFIHDAESAGQEVAKIGKFRWGKAAIIGIPVGAALTYFLAGTGNKEPGPNTSKVVGREQGQGATLGA